MGNGSELSAGVSFLKEGYNVCTLTFRIAAEVVTKKYGVPEHETSQNADGENCYLFKRNISQRGAVVCFVDKEWPCLA